MRKKYHYNLTPEKEAEETGQLILNNKDEKKVETVFKQNIIQKKKTERLQAIELKIK